MSGRFPKMLSNSWSSDVHYEAWHQFLLKQRVKKNSAHCNIHLSSWAEKISLSPSPSAWPQITEEMMCQRLGAIGKLGVGVAACRNSTTIAIPALIQPSVREIKWGPVESFDREVKKARQYKVVVAAAITATHRHLNGNKVSTLQLQSMLTHSSWGVWLDVKVQWPCLCPLNQTIMTNNCSVDLWHESEEVPDTSLKERVQVCVKGLHSVRSL